MKATDARNWAKKILIDCSECFTNVRAVKSFGEWVVKVNGGREACYGHTIKTTDSAADFVRCFKNEVAK
jgi:hypothetical protein